MGRHLCVLLTALVGLVAGACGLAPADDELEGADGACPAVESAAPVEL